MLAWSAGLSRREAGMFENKGDAIFDRSKNIKLVKKAQKEASFLRFVSTLRRCKLETQAENPGVALAQALFGTFSVRYGAHLGNRFHRHGHLTDAFVILCHGCLKR
jgi:hypothetical protein